MLSDALKAFQNMYEQDGDKLILDSYIPDDGEYIIVSSDSEPFEILDRVNIKLDKKTRTIDRTNQYINFICQADYYSKYLNSNKSIANKNIHSNNYLSFYTRVEGVQDKAKDSDKKKVGNEAIEEYYGFFKEPDIKLKGKSKERLLYKRYEEEFGQVDVNKVNPLENWVKENLFDLIDFNNEQTAYKKTFIRILFYVDLDEYKREGNRYFLTKIYNNNDYNIEKVDIIYGLPDNNMGLNVKKPFFRNISRKDEIPHYLSQDTVLMQKKLFEYLAIQFGLGCKYIYFTDSKMIPLKGDETLDIDLTGSFFALKKGQKEIEIIEYDNITDYRYNIRPIKFENILNVNSDKSKVVYGEISTIGGVKNIINEVLFSKFLTTNFFTEPKDLKMTDYPIKRGIIACRGSLFTWFYKGNDRTVWKSLERPSTELILGSIFNGHHNKACERFNLKMSLKRYFEGGSSMSDKIDETKDKLRLKINSNETSVINNDIEYFFGVGQLIYYFLTLNKGGDKKLSLANPLLNSKTDKRLKEELRKMFIKYNYAIDLNGRRFKNLYSMVASYETKNEIDQDILIAGYLHNSLIFEKSDKKSKDVESEEEK